METSYLPGLCLIPKLCCSLCTSQKSNSGYHGGQHRMVTLETEVSLLLNLDNQSSLVRLRERLCSTLTVSSLDTLEETFETGITNFHYICFVFLKDYKESK